MRLLYLTEEEDIPPEAGLTEHAPVICHVFLCFGFNDYEPSVCKPIPTLNKFSSLLANNDSLQLLTMGKNEFELCEMH
jgi:hypothetical protein